MRLTDLTLCELISALKAKKTSSLEVTEACLNLIEQTKEYNNFITVCAETAIESARRADERLKKGDHSPLLGVPVALKDNIATKGVATTCASRFLENFVPPYDATVVQKLKNAGAVIVGKTNMDEFAMGSANENSAFGAVRNCRDVTRVPGGSSGGSANCVAAGQAFAAFGSDTGGSIRQPAAYCGVVGLKPTYSSVSRNGLVAFASSLDQIGPIARTADDCLEAFRVIVGRDEADSTSSGAPSLPKSLTGDVKGKVIGVADEFTAGLSDKMRGQFDRALSALERCGAKIKKVSVRSFDATLAVYYVISSAEAASNLARYDGVKYGRRAEKYKDITDLYVRSRTEFFGQEVKRRIMIGNYVLSSGYYDAYYLKASKVRSVIKSEYEKALSECDALICPTAPTIAPKIGETADPADAYLSDVYTVPVNIAGLPAVSVPTGLVDGMPVGCQIIGRAYGEGQILDIGKALERGAGEA